MFRIGKFIKIESRLVIAGIEERGMGSDLEWVMDFFWNDENVLQLDSGDFCKSL